MWVINSYGARVRVIVHDKNDKVMDEIKAADASSLVFVMIAFPVNKVRRAEIFKCFLNYEKFSFLQPV